MKIKSKVRGGLPAAAVSGEAVLTLPRTCPNPSARNFGPIARPKVGIVLAQ